MPNEEWGYGDVSLEQVHDMERALDLGADLLEQEKDMLPQSNKEARLQSKLRGGLAKISWLYRNPGWLLQRSDDMKVSDGRLVDLCIDHLLVAMEEVQIYRHFCHRN